MSRTELLHSLADKIAVVSMGIPYLRGSVERLQLLPGADSVELAEMLAVLLDLEISCVGTATLFEQLRRAPE